MLQKSQSDIQMWPFSEMSLSAATTIGNLANIGLVGSLVIGVISTFLIVRTADVKERHWDIAREQSRERIAELSMQGDQLRKDTAEANARAMEAKLELEKFKAPRKLSAEQQTRIADKLKAFGSLPFDFAIQTDPEAIDLMEQIATTLDLAGWVRHPVQNTGVIFTNPGKPPAGIVSFTGVEIQIDDSRRWEWEAPASTLWQALNAEGIAASARRLTDKSETSTAIHIKIGKKP